MSELQYVDEEKGGGGKATHHGSFFFLSCILLLSLLCNYACNWHTASYLYCVSVSVLPNCHEYSDWCNCFFLGQTVDHMHPHTHTTHTRSQIFSFSLTHIQAKCFHRGKVMCISRLVAPLPPPGLNINMTHSDGTFTDSRWRHTFSGSLPSLTGSSSSHWRDSFLLSFFIVVYLFVPHNPSCTVCYRPSTTD